MSGRRLLAAALILSAACSCGYPNEWFGGIHGYFLDMGAGVRALSMGRSFVAVADDSSALFYNPAGMLQLDRKEVNLTHVQLFEDTRYNAFIYSMPPGDNWTCGAGVMQLFSQGLEKRDEFNAAAGRADDCNTAVYFSGAYGFSDKFSAGASMKLVNKSFDGLSRDWSGLDVAAMYAFSDGVRFGLNMQNLAMSVFRRSGDDYYDVPINVLAGMSWRLFGGKLLLTGDAGKTVISELKVHWGFEYRAAERILLRGGVDNEAVTMGAGFEIGDCRVDYSARDMGIGVSHMTSLVYKFGDREYRQTKASGDKYADSYGVSVKVMDTIPVSVYHLLEKKGLSAIEAEIRNMTDKPVDFRISYRMGLKKPEERRDVSIKAGESGKFRLSPSLAASDIMEVKTVPTPAKLYVRVESLRENGRAAVIFRKAFTVNLLPYDQFVPEADGADGSRKELMDTLVNWVTYTDRRLADVVKKASEKGSKLDEPVKIIGFQPPHVFTKLYEDNRSLEEKDKDYLPQVRLLYETLKDDYNMVYINQPIVYGNSQRIKLPAETLEKSGNCVELCVLVASLLESIEIQPVIVLFLADGHSAAGWKVRGDSGEIYRLLETNVFGESFDKVLGRGMELLEKKGFRNSFREGIPFDENGIYMMDSNTIMLDVKKIREQVPPSPYIPD